MCTKFGIDNSSRFLFTAQTNKQINRQSDRQTDATARTPYTRRRLYSRRG